MRDLRIGIDVGGTFTDVVSIDATGAIRVAKSPSTPQDPSIGVMAGLEEMARQHGLDLAALLARTSQVVHGTTVATNALLERRGAKVALLTTEGHRDVLEMREGLKPERYNLRLAPPAPLVPRRLRFGVRERMRADGSVITALDSASLDAALDSLGQADLGAVAICYLHAYRNPAHEIATAARVAQALPEVYVSRSSDIFPQIKEYERVSTTVVNAYVGPIVQRYLSRLEERLQAAGLAGSLFIVLSHGGMAPPEEAARIAAATVLSGPAGGLAGVRQCAALLGVPDLISFDVGGTSTDIGLIVGGQTTLSAERGLAGQRIALRSLDLTSVAAGGGSLARVDAGGGLKVGPQSAGAKPGPACYGHGGEGAAVTDANLLLGYLDARTFLGGRQTLDLAAAERAVERIAAPLGLSREETALGIRRLINLEMGDGIRLMTLRRGLDPRRFALLSFGGAAGLHAVDIARELEIPRVIVPAMASVLSAWGMLASDLRYEVSRTHVSAAADDAQVRAMFGEMEHAAKARLHAWFDGPVRIERSAEMRYGEQVFEVDVPLDALDWDGPGLLGRIHDSFHARHEALYTYAQRGQEVVLVNARVAATGVPYNFAPAPILAGDRPPAPAGERRAWFGGWRRVPVHRIEAMAPGSEISGPAIFEAETTTVIAGAGDRVRVNGLGWLEIDVAVVATE